MNHLDPEEQETLTAFEQGQLQPVENVAAEIKKHPAIATATLNSLLTAQIPLSERDLQNLEQIAAAVESLES
jgi:hypothetical protein